MSAVSPFCVVVFGPMDMDAQVGGTIKSVGCNRPAERRRRRGGRAGSRAVCGGGGGLGVGVEVVGDVVGSEAQLPAEADDGDAAGFDLVIQPAAAAGEGVADLVDGPQQQGVFAGG